MKLTDLAHTWEWLGRSLGLFSELPHAIHAPTPEQRTRGLLAFRRLRTEAQKMKAPLSDDEIVALIRAGRR